MHDSLRFFCLLLTRNFDRTIAAMPFGVRKQQFSASMPFKTYVGGIRLEGPCNLMNKTFLKIIRRPKHT